MIEGIPKISVMVITYNQEGVIKRTMDSLLFQRDYLYEICVSDDCSKDRTWDILQEYSAKYPGLFVLNRNNPNRGILENYEKVWTMPTGDVIYALAGDDECGSNWIKTGVDFIVQNNLDYHHKKFAIYSNFEIRYPNGLKKVIKSNRIIKRGYNPISLKIRNIINGRGCLFTKSILQQFHHVNELDGLGEFTDGVYEIQLQAYAEENYYINAVGNIYYSGIGISSKSSSEEILKSYSSGQRLYPQLYNISEKDKKWLEYSIVQKQLRYHFSWKLLKDNICLFFESFEPKYGVEGIKPYTALTLIYRILQNFVHRR